jgi:predicted nucleic acid-binding protein
LIVYVESNFVLELALEQEQSASCAELLNLATARAIRLVIPAFSLAEPHGTLRQRALSRASLEQLVGRELQQLRRTASYSERIDEFIAMTAFLNESVAQESDKLRDTISKLLACAEVVPLDSAIVSAGLQMPHGLRPQDAIIYASVLARRELLCESRCEGF